jgi:hypothetical protein
MSAPDLVLDPGLRDWVLLPILVVMILVGIIRHYASILLAAGPKVVDNRGQREQSYLNYGMALRANAGNINNASFASRQTYLSENFRNAVYVKDAGQKPGMNVLSDPKGMESMMSGMKNQIMMFVPQTVMMGWINAFFAGFVLMRLPFPLTIRFKAMLQSGVATTDLDVRWVSSISWYILNLLGLSSVYALILGDSNSAGGVQAMGGMPAQAMFNQPGVDFTKLYIAEAENLDLVRHEYLLDGIEERIIRRYK